MKALYGLIVVVPVYCDVMTDWECFAFLNNVDRLQKYPFALAVPQSLDCKNYLALAPSIRIVRFPDACFQSADSYSRLCLSDFFYEEFSDYQYLLICQLDAYVFSGDIQHWMSLDLDYIGGAVSKSDLKSGQFIRWTASQNGGLSLRKVVSHRRVLRSNKQINCSGLSYELHRDFLGTTAAVDSSMSFRAQIALHAFVARCRAGFKDLNSAQFIAGFEPGRTLAEDQFWSRFAPRFDEEFRVASLAYAQVFSVQFSLELTLPFFYQAPPFGCHGREIVTAMHRLSDTSSSPSGAYEQLVNELMALTRVLPRAHGPQALSVSKLEDQDG